MNRLRLFIRAFFGFSRMETNAFLLLIPLIFVILFSEPVYHAFIESRPPLDIDRTDSLLAWIDAQERLTNVVKSDTVPMHTFDPNSASEEELVALQLAKPLASRIARYREKGGRFYKKADVLKIFGMDTGWYRKASPWMMIATNKATDKQFAAKPKKPDKPREDINTADTLQLTEVYGIGPTLARRIVKFRGRLGGFITMQQLKEVYGLDSTVVKNIEKRFEVKEGFQPAQLAINEATLEDLLSHPYITRKQAQAIIAYRAQHGALDSLGQLREVKLVDEVWLRKMVRYLSLSR